VRFFRYPVRLVKHLSFWSLDKAVFDDPDCRTSLTVVLYLVPYDRAVNSGQSAVRWTIGKSDDKADRC
jgi:hypothetical protein